MPFDGARFGEEIVSEVKGYVSRELAPLLERLAALESREAEPGPQGEKGDPGDPGERGMDGANGKDADPITREMVLDALKADPELMARAVAEYLAENPPPAGKDGQDGKDGERGADGVDGKDGADGQDGKDGDPGINGKDGRNGIDGKDGVGMAGAIIDRSGALVVTLTDGTTRELGPVVGKDGRDGERGEKGADGLGFDDLDIERPDERTVLIKFTKGDLTRSFELGLNHPVYAGVFKDGEAYVPGDVVTWAGSSWHCNEATSDKPGGGSKAWSLMTKRGSDGKDGKPA
jgi:hypothetical protein